jgi:hypothetical protein
MRGIITFTYNLVFFSDLGLELRMRLLHETVHKAGLPVMKMTHQRNIPVLDRVRYELVGRSGAFHTVKDLAFHFLSLDPFFLFKYDAYSRQARRCKKY